MTKSFGAGNSDGWVVRFDRNMNEVWDRKYGDKAWNAAQSVAEVPGKGFILSGNTRTGGGRSDVWIVKVNQRGVWEWEKQYGGPAVDYAVSVLPHSSGGYVVAGATRSSGAGQFDGWLIGLDGKGEVLWQKTLGKSGNDGFSRLEPLPGGGYLATGYSEKGSGSKNFDAWIMLLK